MYLKGAVWALTASAIIFTGCESKAGTGALIGAGAGAGVGAIVGGGKGALIGGAVGAISGGLIGAVLDDRDQRNLQRESPRTYDRIDNGEQLSVNDVIAMHRSNISDNKIIELINKTGSRFRLNSYQVDRLERAGVSRRVIDYMAST